MKILLVEDDILIGKSIEQVLLDNSYAVNWVRDGGSAIDIVDIENYSLVLLDLGLPEKDGLEVLKFYRNNKKNIPIIIITARDSVEDRVRGLDNGADDYLVKPFTLKELEARVRAILRRHHGQIDNTIGNGELVLNTITKEVTYKLEKYSLTQREYVLLPDLLLRLSAFIHMRDSL